MTQSAVLLAELGDVLADADDDDVAPLDRLSAYVDKLKKRNKRVQFITVASGGHYDPMIEAGIPGAIQWIQGGMQASASFGAKRK